MWPALRSPSRGLQPSVWSRRRRGDGARSPHTSPEPRRPSPRTTAAVSWGSQQVGFRILTITQFRQLDKQGTQGEAHKPCTEQALWADSMSQGGRVSVSAPAPNECWGRPDRTSLRLLEITHRGFYGKAVSLGLLNGIALLLTLPESTAHAQTFQLMAQRLPFELAPSTPNAG